MTVREIKTALQQMSISERGDVRAWSVAFDDEWDRQMEADSEAGEERQPHSKEGQSDRET